MRRRESLSLGFVTGASASLDGSRLRTNAGLGRLLDALSARVDRIVVAPSMSVRVDGHDHVTAISQHSMVPLPEMVSIARALPRGRDVRRAIARVEARSDVLVVQLPFSPPTGLVPARRPRVYHACADVIEVVRTSRYYRGARRLGARSVAAFLDAWQRKLIAAPDSALVAHGEELRAKLGGTKGRAIVSSALREGEVDSVKRCRPADAPFRILFVGYLRPEKGLDVLVAAYREVLRTRADAELVIVGSVDLNEGGAARSLEEDVRRAGGRVAFLGHRAFGAELFQCYADADVLALPSRSEGTPRVLVEARAFRCPVVASRVGGVPQSVEHERTGLLVEPNDARGLAAALLRAGSPGPERERLVEAGLAFARGTTVDAQADALVDAARSLLDRQSKV